MCDAQAQPAPAPPADPIRCDFPAKGVKRDSRSPQPQQQQHHSNGTGDEPEPTPPPPASPLSAQAPPPSHPAPAPPVTAPEPPPQQQQQQTPPPPTSNGDVADNDVKAEPEPKPAPAEQDDKRGLPPPTPPVPSEPTPVDTKPPDHTPNGDGGSSPAVAPAPLSNASSSPSEPAPTVPSDAPAEPTNAEDTSAPETPARKSEPKPKSTLRLATVAPTATRKRKRETQPLDAVLDIDDGPQGSSPSMTKRNRTKVQPYQSPTPELAAITKLSVNKTETTPVKPNNDDKLIVFYKNEYLAVRNAEGGFYVCKTVQNVYRSSRKIKIRWLSQDKVMDPSGETYKADFYDVTDMECVLTTLSLQRVGTGHLKLGAAELARTQSILGRALAVERGEPAPEVTVTEEHPDGLDLSLYKDESQLEMKKNGSSGKPSRKRKQSPAPDSNADDTENSIKTSPRKRSSLTPKKSKTKKFSKSKVRKTKSSKKTISKDKLNNSSLPINSASSTSKTATPTGKSTPAAKSKRSSTKLTPRNSSAVKTKVQKVTPAKNAAKAAQPTPSTSTGKTTRTPRKPPSKK